MTARRTAAGFAPCVLIPAVHGVVGTVVGRIRAAVPAEVTLLTAVALGIPVFASRADIHTARMEVFPVRFIEI